ncbi:MAG TPA: hypothetical protein G4O05_00130, partial [Caldilineae bacterium]|nr:hypothetical protein [Caldilineae bacterium]
GAFSNRLTTATLAAEQASLITTQANAQRDYDLAEAQAELTRSDEESTASGQYHTAIATAELALIQSQSTALTSAAQGGLPIEDPLAFDAADTAAGNESQPTDTDAPENITPPKVEGFGLTAPGQQVEVQEADAADFGPSSFHGHTCSQASDMFTRRITDVPDTSGEILLDLEAESRANAGLGANTEQSTPQASEPRGQTLTLKPQPRVSVADIERLLHLGLAEKVEGGFGQPDVVVVRVPIPDGRILNLVYEYVPARPDQLYPGALSIVPGHPAYYVFRGSGGCGRDTPARVLADVFVWSPQDVAQKAAIEGIATFVLHVVPLGAAADYAVQGEWAEAGISLAGDAAPGLGLLAKGAQGARALWAARGAAVLEGGIAVYRSGQTVYFVVQEDYAAAAGSAGEAVLRLFGVRSLLRTRQARRPVPPEPSRTGHEAAKAGGTGARDVAEAAAREVSAGGDGIPRQLRISGKQFGRKIAKRCQQLGQNPADPRVRRRLWSRIQRIFHNADEIRRGMFRGQGPGGSEGPVLFFRRGRDVLVTTLDGEFVTLLLGGVDNQRFINAVPIR